MKIGFLNFGGDGWYAGIATLEYTFIALRTLGDSAPQIALLGNAPPPARIYQKLEPYLTEFIHLPRKTDLPKPRWWQRARRRLTGASPPSPEQVHNRQVSELFEQRRIDCCMRLTYGPVFQTAAPWITWLPDLQHRHLPEMYPPGECEKLDRCYRAYVEAATLIMVNTESVRRDFAAFAPDLADKARVVPFVPAISAAVYDTDPAAVAAGYHLPEKFFYLPNQFWKHKNHLRVIEALEILAARGARPPVVCTGHWGDPRNPNHLNQILQAAARRNVREQFIILGLVEFAHVWPLMRQAICVLNPSLFEGFSFSVAESAALGKRLLLSDIPAHREHPTARALFFDPQDARALADHMEAIWRSAAPGPDLELEAQARAQLPARQHAFGRAFLKLAEEAVALGRAPQI